MGVYDSYYQGIYASQRPSVYQQQQFAAWLLQQQLQRLRMQSVSNQAQTVVVNPPSRPRLRNERFEVVESRAIKLAAATARRAARKAENRVHGSPRASPSGTLRYEYGLYAEKYGPIKALNLVRRHFESLGYKTNIPHGSPRASEEATLKYMRELEKEFAPKVSVEELSGYLKPVPVTGSRIPRSTTLNPDSSDKRLATIIDKYVEAPSKAFEASIIKPVEAWVRERAGEKNVAGVFVGSLGLSGAKFLQGAYEGATSIIRPWSLADSIGVAVKMGPRGILEYYARNPLEVSRLAGGFAGGYLLGKGFEKFGDLYVRYRVAKDILAQQRRDMDYLRLRGSVYSEDYRSIGFVGKLKNYFRSKVYDFNRFRNAWRKADILIKESNKLAEIDKVLEELRTKSSPAEYGGGSSGYRFSYDNVNTVALEKSLSIDYSLYRDLDLFLQRTSNYLLTREYGFMRVYGGKGSSLYRVDVLFGRRNGNELFALRRVAVSPEKRGLLDVFYGSGDVGRVLKARGFVKGRDSRYAYEFLLSEEGGRRFVDFRAVSSIDVDDLFRTGSSPGYYVSKPGGGSGFAKPSSPEGFDLSQLFKGFVQRSKSFREFKPPTVKSGKGLELIVKPREAARIISVPKKAIESLKITRAKEFAELEMLKSLEKIGSNIEKLVGVSKAKPMSVKYSVSIPKISVPSKSFVLLGLSQLGKQKARQKPAQMLKQVAGLVQRQAQLEGLMLKPVVIGKTETVFSQRAALKFGDLNIYGFGTETKYKARTKTTSTKPSIYFQFVKPLYSVKQSLRTRERKRLSPRYRVGRKTSIIGKKRTRRVRERYFERVNPFNI